MNSLNNSHELPGKVLVVIPTFNERENIEELISRLLALPVNLQILIVDDNSPDETGIKLARIAETEERLHVILNNERTGLGPSLKDGFSFSLQNDFDYCITMDGDLSHSPEVIPALLKQSSAGYDLVIGSRFITGGAFEVTWSLTRKCLSLFGSLAGRLMMGNGVLDCTSGFRCYSRAALMTMDLDGLKSRGHSIELELLSCFRQTGLKCSEVPIIYSDRQYGSSKITMHSIIEAVGYVLKGAGKVLKSGRKPYQP